MKVTILGCGASAGVPLIGCQCAVCLSPNPKNKRTRASILIESEGVRLLVDASPDLRQQALRENLHEISGVLITHLHADHCHGIDDLRSFNYAINRPLPLFADEQTLAGLQKSFAYAFRPPSPYGWFAPSFEPQTIHAEEPFFLENMRIVPFLQQHGGVHSMGLRIGNFAYSTDVKAFPESSETYLQNLDCWIVDCLSYAEKPTHAHLDLTLEWIAKYRPKRAVLTHMGHEFDFDDLHSKLPENVVPAYDGACFILP